MNKLMNIIQSKQMMSNCISSIWRWMTVVLMLALSILQPLMVRAEANEVDAAGDTGWYITTIRMGAVQGKASMPALGVSPTTGKAYVTYYDETFNELFLAYEQANGDCGNNNGWQCADVKGSGISNEGGDYSALAFDPNGALHILFTNNKGTPDRELKGFKWAGGEINQATVTIQDSLAASASNGYLMPSLKWNAASNSMGYVVLQNYLSDGGFKVSSFDFSEWNKWDAFPAALSFYIEHHADPNSHSTNGQHSSLDVAADGTYYISYRGSNVANELYLAFPTNGVTTCPIDGYDPADYPNDWWCIRIDPTDNTGNLTSLHAPQAQNDPIRIAYLDKGNQTLKYAEKVSGNTNCGAGGTNGFKCITVDSIGANASGVQLLVQNEQAVIIYHDVNDGGNEKLKIARQLAPGESGNCGPSDGFLKTWQCSVIDSGVRTGQANKNAGRNVTAAIDKTGRVVAAYTTSDGDLVIVKEKYANGLLFSKVFAAPEIVVGETTNMHYSLVNSTDEPFSEINFVDLADGKVSFEQIVGNSCGGQATLGFGLGGAHAKLENANLAPSTSCSVIIQVKGVNPGTWNRATKANARESAESTATIGLLIIKQSQTITVEPIGDRVLGSAAVEVKASASSNLPVTINSQSPAVCSVVNGQAVQLLAVGTCALSFFQAGDSLYASATANASFQVLPAAKLEQAIDFPPLPNRTLGDAPFSVSATASSGLPVSFASATAGVCTVSGATVTLLATGQCTINADQSGDATYNAATTVSQSFSVAQAGQPGEPPIDPTLTIKVFMPVVQR